MKNITKFLKIRPFEQTPSPLFNPQVFTYAFSPCVNAQD